MASPGPPVPEDRRGSGLDQLPPPASANKPLTPFSIEDILSKPPARRSAAAGHRLPGHRLPDHSLPGHRLPDHSLPDHSLPGHSVTDHSLPGHRLPDHSLPGHRVTDHSLLGHRLPDHSLPDHSLPGHRLPDHSLPDHSLPGHSLPGRALRSHSSPLCALEELASKTFRGLEVSVLQAAEGRDCVALFGQKNAQKKRRKSRTAFTNQQVFELEKRFLLQKYLSPADRDRTAQQLGLTNAQVITWFQNRRAKLKRDLEEMRADVESAKAAGAVAFEKLSRLAELEKCAAAGGGASGRTACDRDRDRDRASPRPLLRTTGKPPPAPSPPAPPQRAQRSCSEDEEIDVDE